MPQEEKITYSVGGFVCVCTDGESLEGKKVVKCLLHRLLVTALKGKYKPRANGLILDNFCVHHTMGWISFLFTQVCTLPEGFFLRNA